MPLDSMAPGKLEITKAPNDLVKMVGTRENGDEFEMMFTKPVALEIAARLMARAGEE